MANPKLSEKIIKLLPGEANKRIRQAILLAAIAGKSEARTVKAEIDQENRLKTGVLSVGSIEYTSDTNANLDLFAWVINFEVFQPGPISEPVEPPHPTFPRPEIFTGDDDGNINYYEGTVDDEGNAQFPNIPDGEVLLRTVTRFPNGDVEVDDSVPSNSEFVSKTATETQTLQSYLRFAKMASGISGVKFHIQVDGNGTTGRGRRDGLEVYRAVGVNNQWNKVCQITKSVNAQTRFAFRYLATNSADEIIYLEVYGYINVSGGDVSATSFNYFGQLQNAEIKAVNEATEVGIYIRTNRSQNRVWQPLISYSTSRISFNDVPPDIENLPAGTQYDFTRFSELTPNILAGLFGADSPSSLNAFVTVSALNSYAYVQEAPINGNHYARKDGVWTAFTPFVVEGTAAEGHVVTTVSGVPTWVAPSGGGGISDAPNDGLAYTRKSLVWTQLSPFDLKQEGATDGQLLAWNSANSRYQPIDSGEWSVGSGFIYKDSPVVIGQTTLPTNATFAIRSKTVGSADVFQFLNDSGNYVSRFNNNGNQTHYCGRLQYISPISGDTGAAFTWNDGTQDVIRWGSNGNFYAASSSFNVGTATSSGGFVYKGGSTSGGTKIFNVWNGSGAETIYVKGDGGFIVMNPRMSVGTAAASVVNGVYIMSNHATAQVLGLANSSGVRRHDFFASGDVAFYNLPTTDPGIPGRLWRSGTTINISI